MEIDLTPENQNSLRESPGRDVPPPGPTKTASEISAREMRKRRAKSSLRLKYEAETHVIERKLGDLEAIREKLGLSQRKMAQLLLVDPSAWTRWTKGDDQAPPHIYRMLQWYLALEEKYPVLDVNFWLNTVAQIPDRNEKLTAQKIHAEVDIQLRQKRLLAETDTEARIAKLRADFSARENSLRKMIIWMAVGATLAGCVIGFMGAVLLR